MPLFQEGMRQADNSVFHTTGLCRAFHLLGNQRPWGPGWLGTFTAYCSIPSSLPWNHCNVHTCVYTQHGCSLPNPFMQEKEIKSWRKKRRRRGENNDYVCSRIWFNHKELWTQTVYRSLYSLEFSEEWTSLCNRLHKPIMAVKFQLHLVSRIQPGF